MYIPSLFTGGKDVDALRRFVEQELLAISRELSEMTAVDLRPIHAAPLRPREGMIVFADGTDWNPGSGKGLYVLKGVTWTFIV